MKTRIKQLHSIEVGQHVANAMHRDLEAALRANLVRINRACAQLTDEVQQQRVKNGIDIRLDVKYEQTRVFQVERQMSIADLIAHIAAEFELDRDTEEEEKWEAEFEVEAHFGIQVNGKSCFRNDQRNERLTLRDIGLRNDQTIFVKYDPRATAVQEEHENRTAAISERWMRRIQMKKQRRKRR